MDETKLTRDQVLAIVASAIGVPSERITPKSVASDFVEWDSMGTLVLLSTFDRYGVKVDMGDTTQLQSIQGILDAFRAAGRLV